MAANIRLDSLSDLVRHKANLKVQCRTCDHTAVIHAARLGRFCFLKTWNTQLGQLGHRLRCSRCRAKNSHLKAVGTRAGPDPFPKSEREWGLLYRRLRG